MSCEAILSPLNVLTFQLGQDSLSLSMPVDSPFPHRCVVVVHIILLQHVLVHNLLVLMSVLLSETPQTLSFSTNVDTEVA